MKRWVQYAAFTLVVFAGAYGAGEYVAWRQQQQADAEAAEQAVAASLAALEVSDVMAWQVEGAGDTSYNGVYEAAGTYNGATYYVIEGGGRYLFWDYEATPEDGWWVLSSSLVSLAKWGHAYHGEEYIASLPANPWVVDSGTAPAPTVSEVVVDSPPDNDPDRDGTVLTPPPTWMGQARLERVDSTTVWLGQWASSLGSTGKSYTYDVTGDSWTATTAMPSALAGATVVDSAAYGGTVYVAMRSSGETVRLYEYDPSLDAWTHRNTSSITGLRVDSPISVVATASNVYILATLTDLDGATRWGGLQVSTATWGATSLTIGTAVLGLAEDIVNAAAVISGDSYIFRALIATDNYLRAYGWDGSAWTAEDRAWGVGTYTEDGWASAAADDLAAWYVWNRTLERSPVRCHVDEAFEFTSYDLAGLLDFTANDASLYVLHEASASARYFRRLDTWPSTPEVTVAVSTSIATISWTFDDYDLPADAQSAYHVTIEADDGTSVYDSTKTTGTASSYTSAALADGGYTATVIVWDEDDQRSIAGIKSFQVGGAPAADTPPTVSISSPAAAATITGDTTITVAASDDNGVSRVTIAVDGEVLATLTAPNDGTDYSAEWDVSDVPNGQHTITATARDTVGQTTTVSHTVTLDAGGDITAPIVSISTPTAGATVGGSVTVTASASDAVGVTEVRLLVDGQLQGTLTAANDGTDYTFTWDTEGWANGAHTLRVVAYDQARNFGFATVAVTLARSLALETKYFFSEQVPFAGVDELWRDNIEIERVAVTAILREAVPADEAARYQVTAGIHVPGTSVNFDQYQRVEIDRVSTLPTPASTYRLALRAQPTLVEAYWEIAETAALRLVPITGDAGPAAFCTAAADATLYRLSSGSYSEFEALDLTTPADAVYLDGQVFCAGEELYVVDLDTGELTWEAKLPSATAYTALGAGSDVVLVGVDTATSHLLYKFAFDALTLVAEVDASVNRIVMSGDVAAIALDDGSVWRWAGGSSTTLTELADTGEVSANCVFDAGSGVLYVGTGTDGEVWYRTAGGDVSLDATLGAGTIRALTRWNSRLYATGLADGALWRRDGNSGWSQWYAFDGVSQIDDLYVDDSDRLWIAATHSGGARIYRLEAADSGDIESGPLPPNIACVAVKTRRAQA